MDENLKTVVEEHSEVLKEHEEKLRKHEMKIDNMEDDITSIKNEVAELRNLAKSTHEKVIEGNTQVLESNKYLREQNANMSQTVGAMATQLLNIRQDTQQRRDSLRELNANNFWKVVGGAVTGTAAGGGIIYFVLTQMLQ